MPKPNGIVVWKGPSQIDGKPIVVLATKNSKNNKTGNLIQTWILRNRIHPLNAVRNQGDTSICGNCRHRGDKKDGKGRSCYVIIVNGPAQVWKSYRKGNYGKMDLEFFRDQTVRLGSYGDPTAVPYHVWDAIVKVAKGWTGYTHLWHKASPQYQNFLMASVDTQDEYIRAKIDGWRTFRVRSDTHLNTLEFTCPASAEEGYRLTCEKCLACSGTRYGKIKCAGDVAILFHGGKSQISNFKRRFVNLTVGVSNETSM